ncbi:MAG: transglutaminase-like domain-containing protein, partial [Acutalibacter sp.]
MMTWSPELLEYTRGRLLAREAAFGPRREEVSAALAACAGEERPLLAYYYATLPLTDVGDYSPAYFLSVARQALAVREEFPWCQALAEHRFLKDVAYPRVNTEELAPCRELFHDALAPRVRGLSLEEAILEVNRWCAEEATYRSTDGRTASPLQVYQRGFGRCGEESTFLVTALRSVGIAARQVYVPWWSHCDDNHAWVEAFDGQGWRYLGACEPEPQLDRGWFTHAAARAVMVHTRAFVQGSREEVAFLFPETDPVDWDIQEGVAVENITARYGDTKRLTVQVAGPDGAPAAGAWVSLSVLNMAAPREIARRQADSQGRVTLGLGKGSVLATAWEEASPGLLAECLVAPEDTQAALVLGQGLAAAGEWDFLPPADAGLTVPALSPSQEEARRACLDRAAALREEKRLAREEARPAPPTGEGARVWQSLTEKDREGELSPQLLEDALAAFAWEGQYPAKAFQEGLLSPRVALEVLTPWRRLLEGRFSPQEREELR